MDWSHSKTRSIIARIARQILKSTSLDDVKALRYFGTKHPTFEQVAFTYYMITSYDNIYCFFFAIRLCSDTQNTSLYHRTWSPKTRVSISLILIGSANLRHTKNPQALGCMWRKQHLDVYDWLWFSAKSRIHCFI